MTKPTGWDTGLCQDYHRRLALWFASRLDARHTIRRWFGEQRKDMDKHDTFQTAHPTCPHCGHELDDDEMLYGKPTCEDDLYALAPNEGSTVVQCPRCDQEYAVQGGYRPHYTSAFSLDEL